MDNITQPIIFENIKNKPDKELESEDDSSDDSGYYFHKLVNPKKTISLNDVQLTKLKQKIESLNKTIEDNEKIIESLTNKNSDFQKIFKLINDSITFLNLDYNMNGVEFNNINTYKKQILSKAFEFAEITKQYDNLISNYSHEANRNIGSLNYFGDFFVPLIHQKYNSIKHIFHDNQVIKKNNNLWYSLIGFIIGLTILLSFIKYV
jgi:hypothetical protein